MRKLLILIIFLLSWESISLSQSIYTREYRDTYIYAYIKSALYQGQRADYIYIHNLSTSQVQVTLLEKVTLGQFGRVVEERVVEKKIKINPEKNYQVGKDIGDHINGKHCYVTVFKILSVREITPQYEQPAQQKRQSYTPPVSNERRVFSGDVDYTASIPTHSQETLLISLYFSRNDSVTMEEGTWSDDGCTKRNFKDGEYYILGNSVYITWVNNERETLTISQDFNSIYWDSIQLRKR